MDWRRYVRTRLPSIDIAAERESEIVEELAQQLEAAYDAARARGSSDADAQRIAETEIADWPGFASTVSRIERPIASRLPATLRPSADPPPMSSTRGGVMSGLAQDVRYAVRTLLRAPGFAAVAIATLALGIGATTIVYSLVDGILLRPLPIHEADRVVLARELDSSGGVQRRLAELRRLEGAGAIVLEPRRVERAADESDRRRSAAAADGAPDHVESARRARRAADSRTRADGGRRQTGSGARVPRQLRLLAARAGRHRQLRSAARITLDERPYVVVGVLPRDFTIARQEDIFRPLGGFLGPGSSLLARGNHNGLAAIGRLAPGATVESARRRARDDRRRPRQGISGDQLRTVGDCATALRSAGERRAADAQRAARRCARDAAHRVREPREPAARPIERPRAGTGGPPRARRRGVADRQAAAHRKRAAGTDRRRRGRAARVGRIQRCPRPAARRSAESSRRRARRTRACWRPRRSRFSPACCSVCCRRCKRRPDVPFASSQLAGHRAATTRTRTRQMLLLAEVALALVLLAGAGLMVRTMANLLAIDPGFEASGVLSAQIALPNARYTREQARDLLRRRAGSAEGRARRRECRVHELAAGAGLELELDLHRQRSTRSRTRGLAELGVHAR